MSNVDFSKGDALDDFLGGEAPSGMTLPTHTLPMDEASVRIRETVPEFTEKCPACKGSGKFVAWSGRTVGQCFKCKGKGSKTFKSAPEVRAAGAAKRLDDKDQRWADFAERFPQESTWIIKSAPRFDFAANMKVKVMQYGDLTGPQMDAVRRGVVRQSEYEANKSKPAVAAVAVQNYPNLKSAFDALIARGVRKAQMTVGEVNISIASWDGRNAGQLYVKHNSQYVGKIVNAVFYPRNATVNAVFYPRNVTAELVASLNQIEIDPRAAVIAHARMTAERIAAAKRLGQTLTLPCGCCGKTLSDPVSIERGIGPVCADKWGF